MSTLLRGGSVSQQWIVSRRRTSMEFTVCELTLAFPANDSLSVCFSSSRLLYKGNECGANSFPTETSYCDQGERGRWVAGEFLSSSLFHRPFLRRVEV